MGVPHDTPADQQKLNEAIAKRDEFKNLDEIADEVAVIQEINEKPLGGSGELVTPKSDITKFSIRKLKTGLCLIYDGEEHFFVNKVGLIKHLRNEVL